ncbi:MAG: RraA family protein [Acidobacteria bacterium]|nr:RraA family protein [Acidobacteriota bacterium]
MNPLELLTRYNTPTIANAIELFELRPRNEGFLPPGLLCLSPGATPVAGYAATCFVSGASGNSGGRVETFDYWAHLESVPYPRISVVQDIDPAPQTGCFWGEVNANIHLALGCLGTITDGGVRDLDEMRAAGFQALYRHASVSHSYVHVTGFGTPVTIGGVTVHPGDIVQIDQHGALLVPAEVMPNLEAAVQEIERRERPVIDYARSGAATRHGLAEMVTKHLRNNPKWTPGQTS